MQFQGDQLKMNKNSPSNSTSFQDLKPWYSFSKLIVGTANEEAYSISKNIIENPGCIYNPLIIFGDTGSGKSHLLHAIGHEFRKKNKVVGCFTAEQLSVDAMNSLKSGELNSNDQSLHSIDILLIDEIKLYGGKESTLETYLELSNALIETQKQVVYTVGSSPKLMRSFQEKHATKWIDEGTVELKLPDLKMKFSFIQKESKKRGIRISHEATTLMSESAVNFRELARLFDGVATQVLLDSKQIVVSSINKFLFKFKPLQ